MAWFDEGSTFRQDLEQRLAGIVRFEVFEWSGRNSMKARSEAATALRERIIECQEAYPHAGQLVIAHSHGGNVAVQAVSHLRSQSSILGVATMGTPFLRLGERSFTFSEHRVFFDAKAAMLGFLMAPLLFIHAPSYSFQSYVVIAIGVTLSTGFLFFGLKFLEKLKKLSKETLIEASPAFPASVPMLVLRCSGDEAALALGLARTFGNISRSLWQFFGKLAGFSWMTPRLILVSCAASCAWMFLWTVVGLTTRTDHTDLLFWLIVLPAALAFGAFPVAGILVPGFALILGVLLLPFGYELMMFGFLLDVGARATPSASNFFERDVDPAMTHGISPRRHSVYAFPITRMYLASWIKNRIRA